jgi:hypothetical protein
MSEAVHQAWLIYIAIAAGYTAVVFGVMSNKGRKLPPSTKSTKSIPAILLLHSLFVAALCGLVCLISRSEGSFSWLNRGFGRNSALWALALLSIPLGILERLWLFDDPVMDSLDAEDDEATEPDK